MSHVNIFIFILNVHGNFYFCHARIVGKTKKKNYLRESQFFINNCDCSPCRQKLHISILSLPDLPFSGHFMLLNN